MISDKFKYIHYLSKTYEGKIHDKEIISQEEWKFPDSTTIYQDSGFQGYKPKNVTIFQPTKKPRNMELTEEQKENNRKISAKRILIEHVIGSVKIFRIVKDTIRSWVENFKDTVMEICCGLHNFKLSYS